MLLEYFYESLQETQRNDLVLQGLRAGIDRWPGLGTAKARNTVDQELEQFGRIVIYLVHGRNVLAWFKPRECGS